MRTNDKKNTSAKKKLIPAVAMLTTSAIMLSTATYAWFTMSREVDVTGIKLTATTPQTIEVSLGKAPTSSDATEAEEPGTTATLWSHAAASSTVYSSFGKLIPASSVNGFNMFYTTHATENGKKVDTTIDGAFSVASTAAKVTFKTGGASAPTSTETVSATTTKDDEGYYLDIPVWFRTTSTTDVNLGLEVDIKNSSDDDTESVLYKAARVAILPETKSAQKVFSETGAKYYTDGKAVEKAADTLAESYGTVSTATEVAVSDGKVTNSGEATQVATVTKSSGTGYGDAVKYYIRVWLEGEDEACWNANVGQDFVINLKFYDLSNTANGK